MPVNLHLPPTSIRCVRDLVFFKREKIEKGKRKNIARFINVVRS